MVRLYAETDEHEAKAKEQADDASRQIDAKFCRRLAEGCPLAIDVIDGLRPEIRRPAVHDIEDFGEFEAAMVRQANIDEVRNVGTEQNDAGERQKRPENPNNQHGLVPLVAAVSS